MLENENDEIINDLIFKGAIVPAGIDPDSGEILYSFTDVLRDIAPHIYREIVEDFHGLVMSLWELGFLDMDVTSVNPLVMATDKALDRNETVKLRPEQKEALNQILQSMLRD